MESLLLSGSFLCMAGFVAGTLFGMEYGKGIATKAAEQLTRVHAEAVQRLKDELAFVESRVRADVDGVKKQLAGIVGKL